MAKGDNPFDPNDEASYAPPTRMSGPPEVPISVNPFDPPAVSSPPPETLGSNVADVAKAASNTFSFGMRDRLEGMQRWLQGDAPSYSAGVDQAVADSAMRRARSPYLSIAGDVAGGAAQAAVPGAGVIGREASLAMGGTEAGLRGTAARTLGYGLEGGVLGGAQAAGHTYTGNPADYARNAVVGGALGTVLGAPYGAAANVTPKSLAAIPNSTELKDSAKTLYQQTHEIPVAYDAGKFWNGLDAHEQNLYATTNRVRSPTVWETLDLGRQGRDQVPPGARATVSPKNIDDLRQQLTGVPEPGAYTTRNWLDNFMASPDAVVRGTPAERATVGQLLNQARGDYRAGKRTETIENINQYAADKGVTPNNALTGLLNPKSREGRWYNPAEKADIRAAKNPPIAKAVSGLGGLMGGGSLPYAGTIGGGGLATAFMSGDVKPLAALAVPAIGAGIKHLADRSMTNTANKLADTMAMNSPLYRSRVANAPEVAGPGLGMPLAATRNDITIQLLNQLKQRGYLSAPEEQQ